MSEQKHIWRLLEIGESTLVGDEFFHAETRCWKRANYGLRIDSNFYIHRRRVPASPIIRDARTDPPKESDAWRGCDAWHGCVNVAYRNSWMTVRWDSPGFDSSCLDRYIWWYAIPPIPEPEKTEAELAFEATYNERNFKDVIERGMTVDYKAVFVRAYEMGKAAK